MTILFLIAVFIATVALQIIGGLAVLVVYLWGKWIIALRAFQVVSNAYQSLLLERSFVTAARQPEPEPEPERPLLFVHKGMNTIH